jgi:hypothetical protein
MGYTHYWTFKKIPKGQAKKAELAYQKAVIDAHRIIMYWSNLNGGLSGYSAHTKLGAYGGINVNGSKSDAHEPFILREHVKQNEGFNFCKTAQKPYDTVVTACLIALQYRLGTLVEVSSDGSELDWLEGLELAKKVLKLKSLKIPTDIESELERAKRRQAYVNQTIKGA